MPRPEPLNPIDKHIGARIKMRRNDLKISQERLADMLDISFQQIQKYEKAMNRVSASRLVKIAELLEVDVEFFYPAKKGNGHGVVNTRMDTFKNYVEMTMHASTEPFERYQFYVQKQGDGAKTPHQIRKEVETQRDALVKALTDALAYIDLHQEPCQFDPPEITAARSLLGSTPEPPK